MRRSIAELTRWARPGAIKTYKEEIIEGGAEKAKIVDEDKKLTTYGKAKLEQLGKVASRSGFVSAHDANIARERAREDTGEYKIAKVEPDVESAVPIPTTEPSVVVEFPTEPTPPNPAA